MSCREAAGIFTTSFGASFLTSPQTKAAAGIIVQIAGEAMKTQVRIAQESLSSTMDRAYTAACNTWETITATVHQVKENVFLLTQAVVHTLNQSNDVLDLSHHAQETNNPGLLQLAQNEVDQQIRQVEHLLGKADECKRHCEKAGSEARLQGNQQARHEIASSNHLIKREVYELRQTLAELQSQKQALSQRLENLVSHEVRELQQNREEVDIILLDIEIDLPEMAAEENTFLIEIAGKQAFSEKKGEQTFSLQNRETCRNCQSLIAKEQYHQLVQESQKLPESLKTSICIQLLHAPVKESALAAAKEFLSLLSGQGQIYCQCLIALAEGKLQDMFMLAQTLSESGKVALSSQLISQGNMEEAEKIVQTMAQGPERDYALCTLFIAQGKDAQAILQAQQTKLPDAYSATLCEKFIASGKIAEAMLLVGQIKDPAILKALCQSLLASGAAKEVVAIAKNLPPEMQLATAKMLLEAGCLKEAMELGMHMPMEQQTALLQTLLQKNLGLAQQFAAKILQNPEQAKQLIQMLLAKGAIAEVKLLLKWTDNPQLNKELAQLLAQEEKKKNINASPSACENEESTSEDDPESEDENSEERSEDEDEEEET